MDSESTIVAKAKPNQSQLYLSSLSLAKPAKLNFFKTPSYSSGDKKAGFRTPATFLKYLYNLERQSLSYDRAFAQRSDPFFVLYT